MTKVAVLDDWQGVARQSADWSELEKRAQVRIFERPFDDDADLVRQVAEFDIIVAMRERSPFPKTVIDHLTNLRMHLTNLRMIAVTGPRTWTMDISACTARHIPVCHTGGALASTATAELALGLLLAAARHIASADVA
jgi:phosphoglycerate dehydrogenase-like enzyme